MIIAIDGPSGAGKSTIGRMLARRLGLLYIDTGAMYRAGGLAVNEAQISTTDVEAVAGIVAKATIRLEGHPDSLRVFLNDRDVSDEIRSEQVGHTASVIAAQPDVRREMVRQQRGAGEEAQSAGSGAVIDGRDIGTVVFPDADLKVFLTATAEQRATRRFEEERVRLRSLTFEETLRDINIRDQRDSTRTDSPLVPADDAVTIDTTNLGINEVLDQILALVNEKMGNRV
ncbi:MAG: (d)CMP kinase [Pyrinomonadaceae bacterium]